MVETSTNVLQASAASSSVVGTSIVSGTIDGGPETGTIVVASAPMEGTTVDAVLLNAMPVDGIILDAQQATVFSPNKVYLPTADGGLEETNVLSDEVSPGSPRDSPVLVSGMDEIPDFGESPPPLREASHSPPSRKSRSVTPTKSPRSSSLTRRMFDSCFKPRSPSAKR